MKIIFVILFSGLVTTTAWAWPKQGDTAAFDLQLTSPSSSPINGKMTYFISGIDMSADRITILVSTVLMGPAQSQEVTVSFTDMSNQAENMPNLVVNCAQHGGSPQSLTTPAGTFQTCVIHSVDTGQNAIDRWYADVPFGIVKQTSTSTDGQSSTISLHSFQNGK